MKELVISCRRAVVADAAAISAVHDAAWLEAYRGVIPGRELERMVTRRGPVWWRAAIRSGAAIHVLEADDGIRGYVSFGRNRSRVSNHDGEIFELYLDPVFQGLGFGRRLFLSARRELRRRGLSGLIVWCLAENERACGFYEHLGGVVTSQAREFFGPRHLQRVAFTWA